MGCNQMPRTHICTHTLSEERHYRPDLAASFPWGSPRRHGLSGASLLLHFHIFSCLSQHHSALLLPSFFTFFWFPSPPFFSLNCSKKFMKSLKQGAESGKDILNMENWLINKRTTTKLLILIIVHLYLFFYIFVHAAHHQLQLRNWCNCFFVQTMIDNKLQYVLFSFSSRPKPQNAIDANQKSIIWLFYLLLNMCLPPLWF